MATDVSTPEGEDHRQSMLERIRSQLPKSRNKERKEERKTKKMTNKQRLKKIAMPMVGDIIDPDKDPQHSEVYKHLTGDESGYQISVAVGAGIHGKGACLAKTASGEIEKTLDNVTDLLQHVGPKVLADFLAERDMSEETFSEMLTDLPE